MKTFDFDINSVKGSTCGLFMSPGHGRHSMRRIRNRWEIIYVISGTLYMFEEDRELEVPAGHTLILKKGLVHGGLKNYTDDLQFYWFHFYADETKTDAVTVRQICRPSRPERMIELLQAYLRDILDARKSQAASDMLARLLLLEIRDFSDRSPSAVSPLAANVKKHIQTHISENIKSSVIAKELGFNADYIERVFKKAYGMTVTQHIRTMRVEHARQLLGHTTLSIAEVAECSGFSSKEDFCRVFKQHMQMTPTAYRKSKTHGNVYSI